MAKVLAAVVAGIFVTPINHAHAQQTWNNNSANKNWSNSASTWNVSDWWANPGTTLYFGTSGSGNVTNNMADWGSYSLVFESGAAAFTLSGNSINVLGKIENNSSSTQTISFANISADNGVKELNPINGNLVINSANLYLGTGGGGEWRVWGANGNTLTVNGVISESGIFRINQNSTVVFQKTNTYTGQTYVHHGQLIISNGARAGTNTINLGGTNTIGASATNALYLGTSSSAGGVTNGSAISVNTGGGASTLGGNNTSGTNEFSGGITLNQGATFATASGGTLAFSGVISGAGGFTNSGSGTVIFSGSGANTASGGSTISAGTTVFNKSANTAAIGGALTVGSGATLRTDAANQLNNQLVTVNGTLNMNSQAQSLALAGSGTVTMNATLTNNNSGSDTFSGRLTSSGALVKAGVGTLILSGTNNDYSGATTVNAGLLVLRNANALGATNGDTTVSSGATLIFDGNRGTIAESFSLNGTGNTNVANTAALINTNSSTNTISGSVTVASDARINAFGSSSLTISGTISSATNRTLYLGGNGTLTISTALSGFNNNSGNGAIFKDFDGNLILAADNSTGLTGRLLLRQGTITITNANNLGTGTFELGNAASAATLQVNGTTTRTNLFAISDGSTAGNINVSNSATFTIAANLTNTSAGTNASTKIGKAGAGTLILAGTASTYAGQIQVGHGTLVIGSTLALGTNRSTANRGIDLGFNVGDVNQTNNVAVLASNGVTVGQSFYVTPNTNSATRTIGLAGNGTNSFTNEFYLDGNLTINAGTLSTDLVTVSGGITNTGGIIKTGSGTVVLSGANTYSGTTTVSNGVLVLTNGSALADAGVLQLDNTAGVSATVAQSETIGSLRGGGANGGNLTIGNSQTLTVGETGQQTYSGVISGSGASFTKSGAGTTTFGGASANTYGGTTTINAGTLVLSKSAGVDAIAGNVVIGDSSGSDILALGASGQISDSSLVTLNGTVANARGVFRLSGFDETIGGLAGNGVVEFGETGSGASTLTLNVASGSQTYSGIVRNTGASATGTLALVKSGAGTQVLSGVNNYSGSTTINGGVLSISAASGLGTNPASGTTNIVLNGGALATTAGMTLGNRGISVGVSGGTIRVAAGTGLTNSVGIYGSGALTKTGTGTLALTNIAGGYSGTATISAGTLQVNTNYSSAAVNIASGGTLMGNGTLGAVTVQNGGTIAPGNSPGTLAVSALTLDGGGSYAWELTDATGAAGTGWDVISVGSGSGTVTLNATSGSQFTINIIGSSPSNWDSTLTRSYDIITAGAWSSSLDLSAFAINTSQFSAPGTLGSWGVTNNGNNLRLTYTAPAAVFDVTVAGGNSQTQSDASGGTNWFNGVGAVVNKLGAGTLVMTNTTNSYTGVTTVKEGTLEIGSAVAASGNSLLGAGTTVTVGDTTNNVAAAFNLAAAVENARELSFVAGTGAADRTLSTTIGSGTATQSGAVVLSTNALFSAASGGTLNVSGNISGSGGATVTNSGTTIFAGNNSYSGVTTVSSNSILVAASGTALGGAGSTTVNGGGTLALSNSIGEDEAITISGAGVGGIGALRSVSGDNSNSGTVSLGANATIAAASGATLTLSNIDTVTSDRNLTVSANGTVRLFGSVSTAGSITNVLQKDGTGSLIFSNSGTTGGIQLQVGNGSVTLAAGSFSTNTSTVGTATSPRGIDLGITSAGDSTNNVAFYASSGVTVSNSVYVAPNSSSSTRTVGTESTSGTVTYSSQFYLGGNVRLASAGTANVVFSGNITNDGTHSVTKIGAGTATLSASNTYSGTAVVEEGTLALSGGSALADTVGVSVNGGTLAVNTTETIGSLSGSGGTAVLTAGLVTSNNSTATSYSGVFTGTGSLSKNGSSTLTLNGNSTGYTGEVILNNGSLLAGNAGAFGTGTTTINYNDGTGTRTLASADATAYTLNNDFNLYYNAFTLGQTSGGTGSLTLGGAGKTFSLGSDGSETIRVVTVNGSHTIAAQMTGGNNNRFAKAGTGAITLSGANTFSGGVQLREGTILVGNNAALGTGTFQVQFDEPGSKTIASSSGSGYTLGNNVNIYNDFTIGQTSGGTGSLTFSGTVQLGNEAGTRNITAASGTSHAFSGAIEGLRGITKLGSGTITLSGSSANTYSGATVVSAGVLEVNKSTGNAIAGNLTVNSGATLLLSGSNQVASSGGQTVTLSGGTITRASGVSEVFGNLNLTAASFLDFGSGTAGTVGFGTYTPSALTALNIVNFTQGNTLTFKSDLSSSINTSAFAFSGSGGLGSYSWNSGTSTFTITAIPEPSTYVAAAGLLAMFLWPVRRRLIKDAKSILGLRAPARDRLAH